METTKWQDVELYPAGGNESESVNYAELVESGEDEMAATQLGYLHEYKTQGCIGGAFMTGPDWKGRTSEDEEYDVASAGQGTQIDWDGFDAAWAEHIAKTID